MQSKFEAPEARDRAELLAVCDSATQSYQPLTRRAAALQSGVLLPDGSSRILSPLQRGREDQPKAREGRGLNWSENQTFSEVCRHFGNRS